MSIVKLSVNKLDKVKDKICERAKVFTGPLCNYNCKFCYYKGRLNQRESFLNIKKQIDLAHNYGIKSIDFSGGESSIEPNWFEFLEYANNKFDYISCISHGGKFADKVFLKKSKEAGLREILFSLHGFSAEIHDKITQRKGSFNKIIQAIKNAKEVGILVRINCTISIDNYKDIDIELLKVLNPFQINLIVVNYFSDNIVDSSNIIYYKAISPYIHNYLDNLKDTIKYLNVRYIPFCFMKGYEKYVIDYMQLPYDLYDWNIAFYHNSSRLAIRNKTYEEKLDDLWEAAKHHRIKSYNKPLKCLKCKYFYICDGMEKSLDEDVHPVIDEKITDPLNYCRNNMIKENPH